MVLYRVERTDEQAGDRYEKRTNEAFGFYLWRYPGAGAGLSDSLFFELALLAKAGNSLEPSAGDSHDFYYVYSDFLYRRLQRYPGSGIFKGNVSSNSTDGVIPGD